MSRRPVLFWFRRDLRLSDHPGLTAACATGGPVVPVFVLDPETEALGAAARWRLGEGIAALQKALERIGSRLILRRGPALETLRALVRETGAVGVHWSRLHAPDTVARDRAVRAALREDGVAVDSHPGHLLHEPWDVATRDGGHYKVFTPYWRAMRGLDVPEPVAPVAGMPPPESWPASDDLAGWRLGEAMNRGASVVGTHARVGQAAAEARLTEFIDGPIADYSRKRDRPDIAGTSRLSENLTLGEISPRSVWHAARGAEAQGAQGADAFLRELGWREFAWHLAWHTPHILARNWRAEWDGFPWRPDNSDAERWRRGMTGEPMVDAGMREMYVTGTMHNRVRMLVATYLTKHLMTHWKVGADWFAECLIDWDPASNALGWQWAAGSGPDAAPYFRILNPELQARKFDPDDVYRRRYLRNWQPGPPHADADAFFEAAPRAWNLDREAPYARPMRDPGKARIVALAAHDEFRAGR